MKTIPRPIKIIVSIIAFTGILALAGLCRAETPDEMRSDLNLWQATPRVHDETVLGKLGSFIGGSGITQATNYAFAPYFTYAPSAPKGRQWGGGMLVIYNVNDFLGAGIGGDFLGQFTLVSGNVQLKVDTRPLSFLGGYATNIVVTPFGLVGAGTPFSGTSQSVIGIADVGGNVAFGHWLGGTFGTGVAWGTWTGAGQYSGERYHVFLDWKKGF